MSHKTGQNVPETHCIHVTAYLEKWLHLLLLFPFFWFGAEQCYFRPHTKVWSQSFVHLELRKHLSLDGCLLAIIVNIPVHSVWKSPKMSRVLKYCLNVAEWDFWGNFPTLCFYAVSKTFLSIRSQFAWVKTNWMIAPKPSEDKCHDLWVSAPTGSERDPE